MKKKVKKSLPVVMKVPEDPNLWTVNSHKVSRLWKIVLKDGWVGFYKKKPRIDKNSIVSTERVDCMVLEFRHRRTGYEKIRCSMDVL